MFAQARRVIQKLDVDREYCLNHFENYGDTAEPGYLAKYYGYYCEHYLKGVPWTKNPEENAPFG
jgi:hypothetical protein